MSAVVVTAIAGMTVMVATTVWSQWRMVRCERCTCRKGHHQ